MAKKTAAVLLLLCAIHSLCADANTRSYDYSYDYWGVPVESVPAFVTERIIDRNTFPTGVNVAGFDDVASGGGKLFLVDSGEGRLNILDGNFEFLASVKLLYTEENRIALDERGRQITLTNPEGVFFHAKTNEIFIADTGAQRILVLDGDRFFIKRIIGRPADMTGIT